MVYPIGKRFFSIVLYPYIKKINGLENVPKHRNFIIAANHASYMDHLIIAVKIVICYLNKRVHFLAKKEHYSNFFNRAFHRWAGAIPVDREKGGREAMQLAVNALKRGSIIAIHPEGTRTLTGKLQRAKTGAVRLALMAHAPILPIGLIGTFEMLPKGKYIPRFKRAVVNIGKLMYFDEYYGKENNQKIARMLTTKLMKEIANLCHQEYLYD